MADEDQDDPTPAKVKGKGHTGFKTGFNATSALHKKRAGELANHRRWPVTLKKFSWEKDE